MKTSKVVDAISNGEWVKNLASLIIIGLFGVENIPEEVILNAIELKEESKTFDKVDKV